MADKFDFIREDTQTLKDAGLFITLRTIDSPPGA
jgi:hypothetical protein